MPRIPELRRVTNGRTGKRLGERVTVATNLFSRARGLLGRDSLPPGTGLWLEPCSSIHMFFMRFAIDVVFVDREQRVLRAHENVRPWRIALGGRGARAAIELPPGTIRTSGTRAGDPLRLDT